MVDPIAVVRRERVYRALDDGTVMTSRQLARRGASWRTVMDLLAEDAITVAGSNERAQLLYAVAR